MLNSSVSNPNATGNVSYYFDDGNDPIVGIDVGQIVDYMPNFAGMHNITVVYSGDDNFDGVTVVVTVNVTLGDAGFDANVSSDSIVYGDSTYLNSSVCDDLATGNVTFVFDDGTEPVVVAIGDVVNYIPLSSGNHTIVAIYSGDDNFDGDTVVLNISVSKSDGSGFSANATPVVFPFRDSTVLNSSVSNPNATGNVTFVFDDGSNVTVPVGTPVVYTPNSTGNHTIVAIYSGDDNFNGANETIIVEVTKIDAGFNAIITPNETALNEPIHVNSSIIDKDATGNVTYIFDDGTEITTNIGDEVEYIPKKSGNHTVKVIYSGDDNFNGAEIILNFTIVETGLKVNIEAITKIIVVGNQAVFNISVYNGGKIPLTQVVVNQIDLGSLSYSELIDESGLWIEITNELSESDLLQASENIRSWRYLGVLYPGETASFKTVYDTYVPGTFDNAVIATSDDVESGTAIDFVRVLISDYDISVIALNDTVKKGEQVMFKVILNNTGETNLTNIKFEDVPDIHLIFDSFIDSNNAWTKNDDLSWNLSQILNPGETAEIILVFNTTTSGNFTNTVTSENKTSNDTVCVEELYPNLGVVKIINNPIVTLGETVSFTIIVTNTGNCDLEGVYVIEEVPSSLSFINYDGDGWVKEGFTFKYSEKLSIGESANFTVFFNTKEAGNITNRVIAGSNMTGDIISASNTTQVLFNDTVIEEENITHTIETIIDGNKDTGNPIFVLLLALFTIIPLRRFKK